MLPTPTYIPVAHISSEPIRHTWDDWDPYPALGLQNKELMRRLKCVSDRAQIAFSIACAEWVVYRLAAFSEDPRPYQFLEASWCFVMRDDLGAPPLMNEEDWKGVVRAPIDLALVTIFNTILVTEDEGGDTEAAFAALIPLHVLNDGQPYLAWKRIALSRLEQFFLRKKDDPWGPPVPREVFDSSADMGAEAQAEWIADFLSRVSPEKNPFLRVLAQ